MDVFPDLSALSDGELKALTEHKMNDEREVSYRRRLLHGQIDLLRRERAERLKVRHGPGSTAVAPVDSHELSEIMAASLEAPSDEHVQEAALEPFPDVSTLPDGELRALIDERMREEADASFQRRLLHGHIDLLRAEVLGRLENRRGGDSGALDEIDVSRLSEILAHRGPPLELADELEQLD